MLLNFFIPVIIALAGLLAAEAAGRSYLEGRAIGGWVDKVVVGCAFWGAACFTAVWWVVLSRVAGFQFTIPLSGATIFLIAPALLLRTILFSWEGYRREDDLLRLPHDKAQKLLKAHSLARMTNTKLMDTARKNVRAALDGGGPLRIAGMVIAAVILAGAILALAIVIRRTGCVTLPITSLREEDEVWGM